MPEIRIQYEDDGDGCPHAALSAVITAAAAHLPVTEIAWVRDDDLDEETIDVTPNLGGLIFGDVQRRAASDAMRAGLGVGRSGRAG